MVEIVRQLGLLFSWRSNCIIIHTFDEARVGTHAILEIFVFKDFFDKITELHVLFDIAVFNFPFYVNVFPVLSFHYIFLHV